MWLFGCSFVFFTFQWNWEIKKRYKVCLFNSFRQPYPYFYKERSSMRRKSNFPHMRNVITSTVKKILHFSLATFFLSSLISTQNNVEAFEKLSLPKSIERTSNIHLLSTDYTVVNDKKESFFKKQKTKASSTFMRRGICMSQRKENEKIITMTQELQPKDFYWCPHTPVCID